MNPMTTRREEWHVTVRGISMSEWELWCDSLGIKPLDIELSTFERQRMCAFDGTRFTLAQFMQEQASTIRPFEIVRVKHEVEAPLKCLTSCPAYSNYQPPYYDCTCGAERERLYYECHVKFDGVRFPAHAPYLMSRDLYREKRFYATKRERTPFDPAPFVQETVDRFKTYADYVGHEYEACLSDSNPQLDAHWIAALRNHPAR
jgi:hypothetical protein